MNWMLAALVLFPQAGAAKAEIDYSKVDRKIGKQPAYAAKPLYAIFLMDAEGKRPIWGVLDKSKPLSGLYDILHLDMNGNGDLVDEGERFVPAPADTHSSWAVIRIGEFKVSGTDLVHTGFTVQTMSRKAEPEACFDLKWAGKVAMGGGQGPDNQAAVWAEKPEEAPVFHPWPYGVLRFCLWDIVDEENKLHHRELAIGKLNRVRLLVGNAGLGPVSFSAVSETFLDLNRDVLRITLIYRDVDGKECRETVQVKEHC